MKTLGELAQEFSRECLMMIKLHHPNLLSCIGFGCGQLIVPDDDGKNQVRGLFVVMELINGGGLNDYLSDPLGLLSLFDKLLRCVDRLNTARALNKEEEMDKYEDEYAALIKRLQACQVSLASISVQPVIDACEKFLQNPTKDTYKAIEDAMDGIDTKYRQQYLQPLDHKRLVRLAVDVARGIDFLHSRSPAIVHRDIKAANVLLSGQFASDAIESVKVGDLGLATYLHINKLRCLEMPIGTAGWIAPEIYAGNPYSTSSDVYSFAVGPCVV